MGLWRMGKRHAMVAVPMARSRGAKHYLQRAVRGCGRGLRMGKGWHGRRVLVHCDNEAAVHMLASRSSRDAQLNHLLRCLFFIEAEFNFALSGTHIAGVDNHLADDLSRDKLSCFLSKLPQAHTLPSPIPKPLTTALLDTHATWTSPSWIQQFINTVSVG